MKKLIGVFVIVLFCFASAQAQEVKTLFISMPDSLSPLLTPVNRADLIDFLDSKMRAQVENRFRRKSEMTVLSKDYIHIQMTPQTTWQMKLLPVNDSTQVICTVSTSYAPAADSDVRFYTTQWNELAVSDYLEAPAMDEYFVAPTDSTQMYEYTALRLQTDMLLAKADLSKDNQSLTFTFTTTDYMDKEAAEKLKPFLRRPVAFVWSESEKRFTTLGIRQ